MSAKASVTDPCVPHFLDGGVPDTHNTLALIFGPPDALDATSLDPRDYIADGHSTWPGVHIISGFRYAHETHTARFLMSRHRAERFMHEGYEVAFVNTAYWRLYSSKVLCTSVHLCGGIDALNASSTWSETNQRTRDLTPAQYKEWTGESGGTSECFIS